jgi:hypothetical protein
MACHTWALDFVAESKNRTMSRGFVLEKEEIQNKYGTQDSGA